MMLVENDPTYEETWQQHCAAQVHCIAREGFEPGSNHGIPLFSWNLTTDITHLYIPWHFSQASFKPGIPESKNPQPSCLLSLSFFGWLPSTYGHGSLSIPSLGSKNRLFWDTQHTFCLQLGCSRYHKKLVKILGHHWVSQFFSGPGQFDPGPAGAWPPGCDRASIWALASRPSGLGDGNGI